ncbi:MAG: hypothetical protein Q7T33_08095 [Dehalococcoidia bacterium]|nr:hypothetical protein [Dehalococcoidia bacterium]
MTQPNLRLPVRKAALPVKRDLVQPPALWRQAAPVVARGAALVAAGVVGEWLLRSAAKRALRLPLPARRGARNSRALARRGGAPPAGAIAVSETLILHRVIVRK